MKGFVVKCVNCGFELVVEGGETKVSNEKLSVHQAQDVAIIECQCGNESTINWK